MKGYQLRVDPQILRLLGPSLYTNIYYVLAELIANAYDADAKNVYIIDNESDIRVEDDGHGMSYENGDIKNYLNVARVSRVEEADSFSRSCTRRKMGRKGVGKLAALSVSENVDILTVADGERSGFVLSRHLEEGGELQSIPDSDIAFDHIEDHGSAIVMRNPQYKLHQTLAAVRRNLLKIFPRINADFRIHVIRGQQLEIIDDFDRNIMKELGTLIALGDEYSALVDLVPDIYPQRRADLVIARDAKAIPLIMGDNNEAKPEYSLKIAGWIGTYKTTQGRKVEISDFPDNFISLFANKKMGEFNILPAIGQNKLNEVYVVGQLHVDLFELTELPDMALSNRQGYKSDDPRYVAVLDYVRKELLAEILRMREIFTNIGKAKKQQKKEDEKKEKEEEFRRDVDIFQKNASEEAANSLLDLGSGLSREVIEGAITKSINDNRPSLGLKPLIDSLKKKIFISQAYPDKPFADIIYQMLLYNNVSAEDILYTNCDDEICRVPEGKAIYDYLREFFVESYSSQKIFVLFVTSENTRASWGAIIEVGASWITRVDHKIFNVDPFRPEHPLSDEMQWQSTNRERPTEGELWMTPLNADVFCQKIEAVCDALGYKKNTRADNKNYLGTLVSIRSD